MSEIINPIQVSLFQILPPIEASKRLDPTGHTKDTHEINGQHEPHDDGFPLRLLDIRRMDLQSSGWETFYVKRAVEDWIKDPSSNLGESQAITYKTFINLKS